VCMFVVVVVVVVCCEMATRPYRGPRRNFTQKNDYLSCQKYLGGFYFVFGGGILKTVLKAMAG
jgi:hypothetical protein